MSLESRVREALHEDVEERAVDDALDAVRRGARRRRVRRTTSLGVAAAVVAAALVATTALPRRSSPPVSDNPGQHMTPGVFGVAVSGAGERFKLVGDEGCSAPCTVVWTQRGNTAWERRGEVADELTALTVAPNGVDGWAAGDHTYWSTHDGGRTWARVDALPATDGASQVGVRAGRRFAWATAESFRGARLWRSPVGSDSWSRVRLPLLAPETTIVDVLPDSRVVLADISGMDGLRVQHLLVGDGTGWQRYTVPCYHVPAVLSEPPGTLSITCGPSGPPWDVGNPAGLVGRPGDPPGSEVDLGMVPSPGSPVGPVRTLFIARHRAVVYGPDGKRQAHFDDLGRDSVRAFAMTGAHAVLVTWHGRVFASDDGGYTWKRLP